MSILTTSYDPNTGIYSYKKDGTWFFSTCPPDQIASKRVDGKWYFVELCVGGGGGGDVTKIYVDQQDNKLQANIDKCFADSKDYANSLVADYALSSYVDQQDQAVRDIAYKYTDQEVDMAEQRAGVKFAEKSYVDEQIAGIVIPEDQDLSLYALKTEVEAGDSSTLGDAKSYTDEQIAAIDVTIDLDDYARKEWVLDQSYITEQPVTDGDAATLQSAKDYTDEQIAAIDFPEGADLSKYAETTYVDSAIQTVTTETDQKLLTYLPKAGGGVTGSISMGTNKITNLGNATSNKDAVNLEKLNDGLSGKVGNTGTQDLPSTTWKIRAQKTANDGGSYSYIAIEGDELKLYHVADPTNDAHGMSRGYADGRYQIKQVPIVFKCNQYAACVSNQNAPPSGSFCGLYNTAPGSSTNANPYFGNFNADIRIHIDKLKNPDGETFEKNERYFINGFVTIFDKVGKLYFKHAITSVARDTHDYVTLHFASRVAAFGTGSVSDSTQYAVIVEGVTNKVVDTTNIPEEG